MVRRMPVTIWFTATKSEALPRVYSQFTLGTLRRKIVSHTRRHPRRSSSQEARRAAKSGSEDIELVVLHLNRIPVQRSRRRPGEDVALRIVYPIVARAEELVLVGDP